MQNLGCNQLNDNLWKKRKLQAAMSPSLAMNNITTTIKAMNKISPKASQEPKSPNERKWKKVFHCRVKYAYAVRYGYIYIGCMCVW